MKLLFIGYLHGFGGAEKMLLMLANEMAKRGHTVSIVGLAENNPCYHISPEVNYTFCPDKYRNRAVSILGRLLSLRREIKRIEPDLVINFNFQSVYLCVLLGQKVYKKTIYAERGDPYDKEYNGFMGVIRKYAFKRIKGFIFQTEGAKNCFDDYVKTRSCIIHNPIFTQTKSPVVDKRDRKIVTVGRLHEQKNQSLLIQAFSAIANDYPEYTLEIYGDGVLRGTLERIIGNLHLEKQVFLMGTTSSVHEKISKASIFVLSSDYEGMPNALMEAMALGIPCISTDCRPGGARELIQNYVNGIIVPTKDEKALSDAIKFFITNPDKAKAMGNEARNIVKSHNPEKIYDEWELFFRSCK